MSRPSIFLALLSGVLLTLPFLSFSLGPVAWIALVPLLAALWQRPPRKGFSLGLLAGVVWGYGGLYWLHLVTVPGYLVLAFYLALYPAVWSGWFALLSSRRPGWLWWAAPSGWVVLEYLRTHLLSGFPWNLLGISQVRNLPLIQVGSLTGVYGVGFLLVLVNTVIASAVVFLRARRGPGKLPRPGGLLPAFLLLSAALLYGRHTLRSGGEEPVSGSLEVTVVQGAIRQELKWVPALAPAHLRTYLDLSLRALARSSDLLIWPESALPYYLEETPAVRRRLEDLASRSGAYLLFGGDYRDEGGHFNSAYLISPRGGPRFRYDKVHLVPFGEYTPLRSVFPFLGRVVPWEEDFSPGPGYPAFPLSDLASPGRPPARIGVLICYEDIFPGPSRELALRGADLLVNVTNDAWFGDTPAPFQHAFAAFFRAVENRVYLARAANTGYSCIIDPWGRVVGEVSDERGRKLFVSGWATASVYPRPRSSFYREYGDVFSWICLGLALCATLGLLPIRSRGGA